MRDAFSKRYTTSVLNIYNDPVWSVVWLGLPLVLIGITLTLKIFDDKLFIWWVADETGGGENLTAILFLVAGILAFIVANRNDVMLPRWLRIAFYTIALLAILIAGEEMSWGQHFFGWETPDWIAAVNIQDETNLHNMAERALDQKPRAVVVIIIFIFGVLVPLFRRNFSWLDGYPVLNWLMPGRLMIPTALGVVLPRLADRVQVWFDVLAPPLLDMPSPYYQEFQELFIASFVFVYVLNIFLRVRRFERTVRDNA